MNKLFKVTAKNDWRNKTFFVVASGETAACDAVRRQLASWDYSLFVVKCELIAEETQYPQGCDDHLIAKAESEARS